MTKACGCVSSLLIYPSPPRHMWLSSRKIQRLKSPRHHGGRLTIYLFIWNDCLMHGIKMRHISIRILQLCVREMCLFFQRGWCFFVFRYGILMKNPQPRPVIPRDSHAIPVSRCRTCDALQTNPKPLAKAANMERCIELCKVTSLDWILFTPK